MAFPGRVPPIQFCEVRNSPGLLVPPRPLSSNRWCISRMRRSDTVVFHKTTKAIFTIGVVPHALSSSAKSVGLHARLINKIPFSLMSEIAYLIGSRIIASVRPFKARATRTIVFEGLRLDSVQGGELERPLPFEALILR